MVRCKWQEIDIHLEILHLAPDIGWSWYWYPGQVQVVERQREINIQQQEIKKKEKELDSKVNLIKMKMIVEFENNLLFREWFDYKSKVKKPAEAEKYRLEKIAEAQAKKARGKRISSLKINSSEWIWILAPQNY